MSQTVFQRSFAPLKRLLPASVSNFIRSALTAFLTPVYFSYQNGHFLSSFLMAAVSKRLKPLPWYTYPCIDFLKFQDFADCRVLEFGAGQSTLFWSERSKSVTAFEGHEAWFDKLRTKIGANVALHLVSLESPEKTGSEIRSILCAASAEKFNVVVIDGLFRPEMVPIAIDYLSDDGLLICDDSEGYEFFERLKDSGLMRVDFYGQQPGVILPHSTSIYFGPRCRFTNNKSKICIAHEGY